MSAEPVDARVREAALDTAGSFVLEAPAGSGKTALLTARYLALLGEVAHPRQILAVTFTRKAAAEMAERIARALNDARTGAEAPPDRPWEARLLSLAKRALEAHAEHEALLRDPHSLLVQTFHGFCASVVRGWPLEAGVAPGSDLLDEDGQRLLLESAVAETLESVAAGGAHPELEAAARRRLAAANNSLAALSGQLADLLRRRDRLPEFAGLLSGAGAGPLGSLLESRVGDCVALFLKGLSEWFGTRAEAWRSLAGDLGGCEERLAAGFPAEVPGCGLGHVAAWKAAARVFLTSTGTARQAFQARSGFPKGFGGSPSADFIRSLPEALAAELDFVSGWPDPSEDNVGLVALEDMLLLAAAVSQRLTRLQEARGLDYLELEVAALRALGATGSPSTGLIFFHEHLQHILVDEAQDVNDTQVRILGSLTEGWEAGGRRTLFVVGDPKQSIYRFRRAEVSLFQELLEKGLPRQGEAHLPLMPLRLESNFRSRPHLVSFANKLFEHVMASPDRAFDEVGFAASAPTRDEAAGGPRVTAGLFRCRSPRAKEGEFPLAVEARDAEARWVAASVARLHAERPRETVAILIPARTHLTPFVAALEERGVPVRLLEGRPMLDQPEVRHLLGLLQALLRPYDDLAWAGLLRSPWCRVDDGVLDEMAEGGGTAAWSERILAVPSTHPEVLRFRQVHAELSPAFGREPHHETLKRFWEALGGPRSVAQARGPQGVSNAMAFLGHLEACGPVTGEEALGRLGRVLEQAYTPPDPKGVFSNVSMMTIHKAKGLEFDHVFAVALDYDALRSRGSDPPAFLMDRVPGPERRTLAASAADRRTGARTLAYVMLEALEKGRRLSEYKRQFYVAATRARESLALTGLFAKRSDASKEGRSPRAVHWLWQAIRDGRLGADELDQRWDPEPDEVRGAGPAVFGPAEPVPPFDPVRLPYRMASPSKVEDETAVAVAPGADEPGPFARAKGVVVHRLLETLLRGGEPPPPPPVAAALAAEGLPADSSRALAEEVLRETRRAWALPAWADLRDRAEETRVEWPIEDFDGRERLRVGRVDLALRVSGGWVIVDYKTGRADEDVEAWVGVEKERYAPQLRAYAEMAARVLGEDPALIRCALLFTSLPRLVWLD